MPCVYATPAGLCPGKAPLSKNEHYLPRALGNFKNNEPLVDRICDDCQKVCSKLEDVFAHNSSEAFFREMVGRVGRKKHKQKKSIFYEPTHGIPPLGMLGRYPGHNFEILWELIPDPANLGTRQCAPMSQLVLISKNGGRTLRLPFRQGKWTPGKIRQIAKSQGVTGEQIVAIANSDEEYLEIKALTDALAPQGKELDAAQLVTGVGVAGEMKVPISELYLRAIAKVGFHFLLKYFSSFTGFEPEFDEVKRFIHAGKTDRPIVRPVEEPFLRDLQQKGARLNKWCHLLSAQSTESGIEARMQFFAGPEVEPIVWSVVFTQRPSNHIQCTGYVFVYFDEARDGYDGVRGDLIAV
jgi:hypothetical protein